MMTNKKHSSLCLDGLHQLKKDRKFCDVTIEADGSQFHVHRAVLASCSPYFYAMFCSEMEESKKSVISIREIPANAMETILEYCYTAKIDINEESVQYLLPAASLLQMGWVRDSCCEFLKNQLCSFNCLGVRAFADTHDCHELCNAATTFAQQNYLEVLEAEEFLELDFEKLVELIQSDDLNITSEEQVYESVIKWVKHDIDTRYVKLPQILEHVRLPLLDKHYLVNVVGTEALIRKSAECRDLLDDAKDYLLIPEQRVKLSGPRTRPRKPMKTNETLFAVGGWCNGDAISMVEQYDTESKKWKEVAHMSKRRCGVGIAVVDSLLYAIGGHDGGSYLNSIERFDPKTNSWSSDVAPTSSCRTSVGVAVLDGKIYAVGGQDGISCLSIVEWYVEKNNYYVHSVCPSVSLSDAHTHTLSFPLSSYDPTTNTWSHVTSMNTHRLGVAVGVLGGCLYAVGGSDGSSPLNTVERYMNSVIIKFLKER